MRPIEIEALLAAACADGVDTATITTRYSPDPNQDIPLIDYFRIERDIARALDDLTAHMSTRKLTYQTGSFVVDQVKTATTLAEAMSRLADYFNMMHGGPYNSVQRAGQTITLTIDDRAFPYSITEPRSLIHLIGECVQIKVHCLLDSLSEGLAAKALRRVAIVRADAASKTPHLSFWARPPQAGRQSYALTYDLTLASGKIPRPESLDLSSDGIFSRVINHLEKTGESHREQRFTDRALDLITEGEWQQDRVAEHLGVSVATLRRRLSEEGASFRDLVKENRLKQAETMLLKGHSVQRVTEALNYSDIRAFNRAFKRWIGTTPAAFSKTDQTNI